jgi:hypothetical protein
MLPAAAQPKSQQSASGCWRVLSSRFMTAREPAVAAGLDKIAASDVLGVTVYNGHSEEFEFQPGPVFSNILLAAGATTATACATLPRPWPITTTGSPSPRSAASISPMGAGRYDSIGSARSAARAGCGARWGFTSTSAAGSCGPFARPPERGPSPWPRCYWFGRRSTRPGYFCDRFGLRRV